MWRYQAVVLAFVAEADAACAGCTPPVDAAGADPLADGTAVVVDEAARVSVGLAASSVEP